MIGRYTFAITTGTFMTFALLYIMQSLISLQPYASEVGGTGIPIHLDPRVPKPPTSKPPERINKEQLTKTELPPTRIAHRGEKPSVVVGHPGPLVGLSFETVIEPLSGSSDNGLVTLMRASPIYPHIATIKGLEGFAIVQFDVGADGVVHNAVVIESSHTAFNKSSIEAALRFKFKPRVVDGVAVATVGLQNVFRYELND